MAHLLGKLDHGADDEKVGVCVVTKRDGAEFHVDGSGDSAESLVVIVRSNGESTVFPLGDLEDNLASVPSSFSGYR